MLVKLKLKNSDKLLLLDADVYEKLKKNKYFEALKVLDNVREHSNGYPIFQKYYKTKDGFKVETIYIHKYIASQYIDKPETKQKLFVRFINGDTLDCKVKNLEWVTMNQLRRCQRNTPNSTGFRGVIAERNKFRAIIYVNKQRIDLGTFPSAEEAAMAYNKKSQDLFGDTGSLNKMKKDGSIIIKDRIVKEQRPRQRSKRVPGGRKKSENQVTE